MRTLITHGALMGWKREPAAHGVVLTVQIASSAQAAAAREFQEVGLALNDRQLRSLTRDLMRALNERGLDAFSPTPLWLQLGEWLWPGKRDTGAGAAGRDGQGGSEGGT